MAWLFSNQWAAGFFDGEGCVSVFRRKRGSCLEHRVVVQITQKDPSPLHIIAARFGGTVSKSKADGGCFRWRADGANGERFLLAIRKHSLVKSAKIEVALEIRRLIGRAGHRLPPGVLKEREALVLKFKEA